MEKAIKIAIENGYAVPYHYRMWTIEEQLKEMVLDPLFWQALGKGLGWSQYFIKNGENLPNSWLYHWHHFIDHLAQGKDIENFFTNLVKTS